MSREVNKMSFEREKSTANFSSFRDSHSHSKILHLNKSTKENTFLGIAYSEIFFFNEIVLSLITKGNFSLD